MRPYNFPTFRLAQFSGLLQQRVQWFEFVRTSSYEETIKELSNSKLSNYRSTHFHFNKLSKLHSTQLTSEFIQHMVMNAFVPILFSYGKYIGNQDL